MNEAEPNAKEVHTINQLHRKGMDSADQALIAQMEGRDADYTKHSAKAFTHESKAAWLLFEKLDMEPSRGILFRSAAELALRAKLPKEAERQACAGLSGTPHPEIRQELRDVLFRAYMAMSPPHPFNIELDPT